MSGLGFYESDPGVFATEQMAALAEERDTAWLRRLDLETLTRRTPRQPDLAVVERRLRALSDALEDLHRLHDVDAAGCRADPVVTRAVADVLALMPRYVDEVATFLRSASG